MKKTPNQAIRPISLRSQVIRRAVMRHQVSPLHIFRALHSKQGESMNTIRAALLSSCLFLSVPCAAQEAALNKASHDFALSKVTGLMYVRGMSKKCPFEKNVSETFETVALVVAAGIPKLPQEEIDAASRIAQARVERDIAGAKEESCKKAQAAVQATAEEIATLRRQKK